MTEWAEKRLNAYQFSSGARDVGGEDRLLPPRVLQQDFWYANSTHQVRPLARRGWLEGPSAQHTQTALLRRAGVEVNKEREWGWGTHRIGGILLTPPAQPALAGQGLVGGHTIAACRSRLR